MRRPATLARVLWCEVSSLAIVLTGDIPLWLSILVLTLIPILGLASPQAAWIPRARRLSSLLAGVYLLFFPLDWLYLSGRLIFATVHLMFYLKLHTLLQQGSGRERARLHLICLFEMLAAASMTVDASFILPLVLFVLLGTLVLLTEQVRTSGLESAGFRAAVGSSLAIGTALLLLAVAIFMALPRSSYGGFRLGGLTGITMTGFSEQVRLGDFEEIKRSRDPVMRILSEEGTSVPRWRGPAYDLYDSGEWRQTLSGVSSLPSATPGGFMLNRPSRDPLTRTEVFLEPLDTDVLFLPPASSQIVSNDRYVFIDPYWTLRTGRRARAGRHYVVRWHPTRPRDSSPVGSAAGFSRLSVDRRRLYTQLPALSERFHDLASGIGRERSAREPLALARDVERFLEASYRYSLRQPERRHADPVEDFLFAAGAGHCEYFATAMVLLLRARGVPARLVTGFNRGERNAVGGFEVVRRTNAHAWVEVFDETRSWVAFDPTPASTATTEMLEDGFLSAGFDSLRMLWDMYVVAFDLERQRSVLGRAGRIASEMLSGVAKGLDRARRHAKALAGMSLAAIVLVLLSKSSFLLGLRLRLPAWSWRRRRAPHGVRFYEVLTVRLARLGIVRRPEETPAEFASTWEERLPGLSELTEIYYRVRFGGEILSSLESRRAERLAATVCLAALGDGRRIV